MNTKTLAAVAIFSALTVALNMSPIKIPAPFAPFLYYQVWEIPIVTAFLLYGPKAGVAISIINTTALLALFPGALPTGPLYNLAAVLSMLLGIYVVHRSLPRRINRKAYLTASSTLLGSLLRVGVMTIINWVCLRYPPPIGFSMPQEAITAMIPLIAFFNFTLALYTVPAGYVLANVVSAGARTVQYFPSK
jgi:riboflavin transporter FmnP